MMDPTDPRAAGGDLTSVGPGKNQTIFNTERAVLLASVDVALVETYTEGESAGPALAMMLQGRINKTLDQARILYLLNEDGAAAIVSELVALASRIGPEFRNRLLDRLQLLNREGATLPANEGDEPK